MSRCTHCPRCIIAYSGACFTFSEFTDCIIVLICLSGSKGPKFYSMIICVVSWPMGVFLAFLVGFSLVIHILSPWHIRWPLSILYHHAVILLPLLLHLRGMVLFVVPPLCDPLSSIPHSLQGILLLNRRQLILTFHDIILYLLVAPSCNYFS